MTTSSSSQPTSPSPGSSPPTLSPLPTGSSLLAGKEEAPQPFDLCGPLPEPGVSLLEASAGTGKTFTVAALVTRLVAEGRVPITGVLAVTFTRLATGELRERVRQSLASAEGALNHALNGAPPAGGPAGGGQRRPPPGTQVLELLCRGGKQQLRQRHRRVSEALANFDSATITTTHGFCHLVLGSLGVAGEVATEADLLEDASELVGEVVDDLYLRAAQRQGALPFSRKEALELCRLAFTHSLAPIIPAAPGSPAWLRAKFAQRAREELGRRLLDLNLLTFDALLSRLARTLADPQRAEAASALMRSRYPVVLVDEFQDTDPVQWEVVRRAFANGTTTLVLVGDPKQAIYAFRGADVHAYLEAARSGARRYTLTKNWRASQDLLDAYDALFDPVNFGHPEISYHKVSAGQPGAEGTAASPPLPANGTEATPAGALPPLRLRVAHTKDHDKLARALGKGGGRAVKKATAAEWVAADLADDIAGLLSSGARAGPPAGRPVRPGDIAVLVRTNEQARTVQRALRGAGVSAVLAGADSVLTAARASPSPAARAWLQLLDAVEQPASRSRAAAVAIGPFFGMPADALATASEAAWDEVQARLRSWADTLRSQGVAALFKAITAQGLAGRLLSAEGGERLLTDLAHLAELLHAQARAHQASPPALRTWLAHHIEEAAEDNTALDERSRRLESDAEAVQVLTVHRAKGLEFPIVYCPYLWDAGRRAGKDEPVVFHEGPQALLDLGPAEGGTAYEEHKQAQHEEARGEELRQLYVALTRARYHAVVWWVRATDCQHSPLGRLVMARDDHGNVAPDGAYTPRDEDFQAKLEELARRAPGRVVVERCSGPGGRRWEGAQAGAASGLQVAAFDRQLDNSWRRTSYSAVTLGAHEPPGPGPALVGSEPEDPGTVDEPGTARAGGPAGHAGTPLDWLQGLPCPLGALPASREVGTLAHRVLERAGFAGDDLEGALAGAIGSEAHGAGLDGHQRAALAQGLAGALRTPLGPLVPGLSLADVRPSDRLAELSFELPLAGGDHPSGQARLADLAELWARSRHEGPGVDLAGYAARLSDPTLAPELRGYLTGSLDLVFRAEGPSGAPRFFLVDYKTNRLAGNDEPLTAWHYRPAALAEEMYRAHYPLQALFYLVALHRYLRWRLPGYRPEVNLGGALYLFVRGMLGPAAPLVDGHPCGVFSWQPPVELVVGASGLLGSGQAAPAGQGAAP